MLQRMRLILSWMNASTGTLEILYKKINSGRRIDIGDKIRKKTGSN